jgi:hypothetical protein
MDLMSGEVGMMFDTTSYGLSVTAGTPKSVVDQLHSELLRILSLPDIQARLKGLGGEPGRTDGRAIHRNESCRVRAFRQADPEREHPHRRLNART